MQPHPCGHHPHLVDVYPDNDEDEDDRCPFLGQARVLWPK